MQYISNSVKWSNTALFFILGTRFCSVCINILSKNNFSCNLSLYNISFCKYKIQIGRNLKTNIANHQQLLLLPLTPMGVLAPCLCTLDGAAGPPISIRGYKIPTFFVWISLQAYPIPFGCIKSCVKFQNPASEGLSQDTPFLT